MNNKSAIIKTLLNNQFNIRGNTRQELDITPLELNLGSLKLKLSGRLRGVSMARVLHFRSNIKKTEESNNINLGIIDKRKEKKNKKLSDFNKIKTYKSSILKKNSNFTTNTINHTNTAVKPQTLNSISTYRLQYLQKDVYTKWGIIGVKLWLYNKA